jgi:hypothetical protein
MNATKTPASPADLTVIRVLAALLERLEQSKVAVDAEQYRVVVARLLHELSAQASNPELMDILDAYPAAAELYENTNYQHAGLCRAALDTALAAERQATAVIAQAMGRSEKGSIDGKN